MMPALAIAALLVLILNPFQGHHARHGYDTFEELGMVALQDHVSSESMAFTVNEVADIPAWFEDKLGYAVSIPDMLNRGFSMIGDRVCELGDCKAAYITYKMGNKKVSLFILPEGDMRKDMDPGRTYTLTMNGNEFEFWKAKGQLHTLII